MIATRYIATQHKTSEIILLKVVGYLLKKSYETLLLHYEMIKASILHAKQRRLSYYEPLCI